MCVGYRDGLPACGLVVDLSSAEGGRLQACGGLRRLVQLQSKEKTTEIETIKKEKQKMTHMDDVLATIKIQTEIAWTCTCSILTGHGVRSIWTVVVKV